VYSLIEPCIEIPWKLLPMQGPRMLCHLGNVSTPATEKDSGHVQIYGDNNSFLASIIILSAYSSASGSSSNLNYLNRTASSSSLKPQPSLDQLLCEDASRYCRGHEPCTWSDRVVDSCRVECFPFILN
jgi:hypothetical protein